MSHNYSVNGYACQFTKSGKLAGVIYPGGSPCEVTRIQDAWVSSKEDMEDYVKFFKTELQVVPIHITVMVEDHFDDRVL